MAELFVLPVMNGILPYPDGGPVRGLFLDPYTSALLNVVGEEGELFLAPYSYDTGQLFPVGVVASLDEVWTEEMFLADKITRTTGLFGQLTGLGRGKAAGFYLEKGFLRARNVLPLDLRAARSKDFPVIEGAGWQAQGGFTEMRSPLDLRVTIYGNDVATGEPVEIQANLGGLVQPEQAHTLEHSIIRSLQQYGLCTQKTLATSLKRETEELKESIELAYRYQRPEFFGVTSSGSCGNPLSNLAQFHLVEELVERLNEGSSLFESLEEARRRTLSKLASELELSTQRGLRSLQGLKKGMLHDDTVLGQNLLKRVLSRFPFSPWE